MIDTKTIKCPKCGWDSLFPLNQPIGLVLSQDVICPHCGTIVICAYSVINSSEGYFLNEQDDYYKYNHTTKKFKE